MTKTDVRELVLEILLQVNRGEALGHIALRNVLDKYQYLSKQERSFISRVTEGTLEYQIQLDYIINRFSKVKVNKMKPLIRCLLRMSVYQIKYMDSIPDSAVCNEAVKLAKKRGFSSLSGFVNGVLRSIARGLEQLEYPDEKDPAACLSVRYSVPEWLVKRWLEQFGFERTEEILQAFLEENGTTIRVRTDRITPEELAAQLREQEIEVEAIPGMPEALLISHYDTLRRIPAFEQGLFAVQDVSSMLAAKAACVQPGAVCLDVCAAPGGKSLHLAQLLREAETKAGSGEHGSVTARDLTEMKVQLIQDNIRRSGLTNIQAEVWDALVPDPAMTEKADVVLADLPCSGLGVIGRKPDIKYRVTEEALASLAQLQRQILDVVWQYVKPGGILVYSTCTINPAENQENALWFEREHPFTRKELPESMAGFVSPEEQKTGMCQLLPEKNKTDGFFIAVFQRRYS